MTVREYIIKRIGQLNLDYDGEMVDAMLERLKIDPDDELSEIDSSKVDLFFYYVIPDVLMRPFEVSEGQYSIKYDKDAIVAFYKMLARRLGLPDEMSDKARIKDISYKW